MIAPLQTDPERRSPSPRLMAARSMIAAMFLPSTDAPAPRIAPWKAWLFVAWVALTMAVYGLSMTGLMAKLNG